jgi:S1-C subfamily serine protease
LKKGNQILSIDGAVITSMADLRVMMWDKLPGDEITLSIRRKHWFAPAEELSYQITLQ